MFEQAERELKAGVRQSRQFGRDANFKVGNFFVLGGLLAFVAEQGGIFRTNNNEPDARLRVVYFNGTESNLLMRSLQRALYKDEKARMLTGTDMGPLFGDMSEPDDIESGTIYVLRSLSSHPFVAEHRELIHKNRVRLENIFHRLFGAGQLDLTIDDRFGHPVKPMEWFLVPLHVIDEAVGRIRDGSITNVVYDPQTARLVG